MLQEGVTCFHLRDDGFACRRVNSKCWRLRLLRGVLEVAAWCSWGCWILMLECTACWRLRALQACHSQKDVVQSNCARVNLILIDADIGNMVCSSSSQFTHKDHMCWPLLFCLSAHLLHRESWGVKRPFNLYKDHIRWPLLLLVTPGQMKRRAEKIWCKYI